MLDADGGAPLDILMAEGNYPEGMVAKPNTRLYGGFSNDFLQRDGPILDGGPRVHETQLTGQLNPPFSCGCDCYSTVFVPGGTRGVVVDGLSVLPPDPPGGPGGCAVYIHGDAIVTVSNNYLRGPRLPGNLRVRGVQSMSGSVIIDGNLIDTTRSLYGGEYSTGIEFLYPTDGVGAVTNNRIRAAVGLILDRDPFRIPRVEGNRFEGNDLPGASTSGETVGVKCKGGHSLVMRNNVITPNRPLNANWDWTAGLAVSGSCRGLVEHNVIEGGTGAFESEAINLFGNGAPVPAAPLKIVDNLLTSGGGAYQQSVISEGSNGYAIVAHNTALIGVPISPSYSPKRVAVWQTSHTPVPGAVALAWPPSLRPDRFASAIGRTVPAGVVICSCTSRMLSLPCGSWHCVHSVGPTAGPGCAC